MTGRQLAHLALAAAVIVYSIANAIFIRRLKL